MSALIERIKTRGYWNVIIRPTDFDKERILEIATLKEIITRSSLIVEGWDFPPIDREKMQVGIDWIQQEVEWSTHLETWRFYQSGQFIFLGSIHDDWLEQSFWGLPPEGWKVGAYLSVFHVVIRLTAIFELAARLAMTEAGGESIGIQITLSGLKSRRLNLSYDREVPWFKEKIATVEAYPQQLIVPREQLVTDSKILALNAAKDLFERFNWTAEIDFLREIQVGLRTNI